MYLGLALETFRGKIISNHKNHQHFNLDSNDYNLDVLAYLKEEW